MSSKKSVNSTNSTKANSKVEDEIFSVEKILNKRVRNDNIDYFI